MQYNGNRVKINVKDGRIICPVCGKGKLPGRLLPGSGMKNVELKCKLCGATSVVNISA